jgi:asparagine synthase (glutamine-hydrolysing)
MVLGATGKSNIQRMKNCLPQIMGSGQCNNWIRIEADFICLYSSSQDPGGDERNHLWVSTDKSQGLIWHGEIYNWRDILISRDDSPKAERLWQLYQKQGSDFLKQINGDFFIVLWDKSSGSVVIARDKIGVREIFYKSQDEGILFGDHPGLISQICQDTPEMDMLSLMKFLVFCYNPGTQTFYQGIKRLRPGHFMHWRPGFQAVRRYWQVSFIESLKDSEEDLGEEIRNFLTTAVSIRKDDNVKTGAFLSGGLDSSTIVSLLHSLGKEDLSTYSFRCRGDSFDESHFAQIVADTYQTNHQVVEYRPDDVCLVSDMVTLMLEPFCDVGINIATYLLAQASKNNVDDLFTGDGGDELFAGHPVYTADKVARLVHWIPGFIRNPVFALGRKLSDSEKKKDWKVKIKRFSKSYAFPDSLGTHRWRAYYLPGELAELVNPDLLQEDQLDRLYEDVIEYNEEGKSYNSLGQSLYSDYQTVVQFYLRRMDMVRALGIRPKFPMLDPRVIELCASIPSRLKIKGFSDAKHIEKTAVAPLLPAEIVHRKDKLGHSIPLKNWMRENDKVKQLFGDLLSESVIRRRGFLNSQVVSRMMTNHFNKTENNSHRLWALVVLELWMQRVWDHPLKHGSSS